MVKCKKCGTSDAIEGELYCEKCKTSKFSVKQSQEGEGSQEQEQNITTPQFVIHQKQNQKDGGTQAQSISTGGEANGSSNEEVIEKLSQVEENIKGFQGDLKQVSEQLSNIIDNQIKNQEGLKLKIEELGKKEDSLSTQISDYESRGDFDKADELQQQVQLMHEEMKLLFSSMQENIDGIAENIIKVIENQDLTEEFLKDHLQSDWEKIKGFWQDYKEGKINKITLIKEILKKIGVRAAKKILSIATTKIIS